MRQLNNIVLAAALIIMAGCSKMTGPEEAREIRVEAGIGHLTRVSYGTDGIGTSFTSGDQIAVYAWTGSATAVPAKRVVDGVLNTLGDSGQWTPATPMLWAHGGVQHYFLGIYPAPESVSNFTAAEYNLNPAAYTASDLMVATNLGGVTASQGAVGLVFDHLMSKLVVNLKFRNEFGGTPAVTSVTALAKNSATVNFLDKTVQAKGDQSAVAIPSAASAPTGYALSFSGLQVPQAGVRKVIVTIGTKNYVFASDEDIPLTGGKYTTLGLVVGKDKIELTGISVSDWTAGADLTGGEAGLVGSNNVHAYVDMGSGLKWATCNIGADEPQHYGDYLAWGAIKPYYQEGYSQEDPCSHWIDGKDGYNWKSYPFMKNGQSNWWSITKYTFADGKTNVTLWYDGSTFKGDNGDGVEHKNFASYNYADDAARQRWGGTWRTPTEAEWTWLREYCQWDWQDNYNSTGVAGMLVTSKVAGFETSRIFLPATGFRWNATLYNSGETGYYWSSDLDGTATHSARYIMINSTGSGCLNGSREAGQFIRPVTE